MTSNGRLCAEVTLVQLNKHVVPEALYYSPWIFLTIQKAAFSYKEALDRHTDVCNVSCGSALKGFWLHFIQMYQYLSRTELRRN